MKVGISLPQLGEQATRENIISLSKNAEKEGFDSLWGLERLLWPLKPSVPYPSTPDGSLPVEYQYVLDPLELLTFVAAKTERITLGTGVLDMFFRSPVIMARSIATLDILSQGRLLIVFGIGAYKEEYQVSNIPFRQRGERADEYLTLLRKIWRADMVEFDGKFYNIPSSIIGPKPIQKPHVPIYLGGFNPKTFERIVKHNVTGWIGGVMGSFEHFEKGIKLLKNEALKAGKNPDQFKIVVLIWPLVIGESGSAPIESKKISSKDNRLPFIGIIKEIGKDLHRLNELAVEHVVYSYNFLPEGRNIQRVLDISKKLLEFVK